MSTARAKSGLHSKFGPLAAAIPGRRAIALRAEVKFMCFGIEGRTGTGRAKSAPAEKKRITKRGKYSLLNRTTNPPLSLLCSHILIETNRDGVMLGQASGGHTRGSEATAVGMPTETKSEGSGCKATVCT